MFRRLPQNLPQDPTFPNNLKELGYFINEEDRVVKIEHPDETFLSRITNNDRYNEVHAEAFNACIRQVVVDRLQNIALERLYLPQLVTSQPDGPHVSILTSRQAELCHKKRIIVISNHFLESLGIWDSGELKHEAGIDHGSVVAFLKETSTQFQNAGIETPGFIVLNEGELLYSHEYNRAMSYGAWSALPRPSVSHPPREIHSTHNFVPGHEVHDTHVKTVFESVIMNPRFVSSDASVFVVSCGDAMAEYLGHHWSTWKSRVAAIALVQPHFNRYDMRNIEEATKAEYCAFLAKRGRAWTLSDHPVNEPLHNPTSVTEKQADTNTCPADEFLYPVLSSGVHSTNWTAIMARSSKVVVEWFKEVAMNESGYENPVFDIKVEPASETRESDWWT